MAVAMTDTVLNYSGILRSGSDNKARLLDAVYSRGRSQGEGIYATGARKVSSIEFVLASNYSIGAGTQPAISENTSLTAPEASSVTRNQKDNCIQIFQASVGVSYLKQSANGTMAGLNIAGQSNNVPSEIDFQISAMLTKMRKDMNHTLINGTYHKSSSNTDAWKSRGLLEALDTDSKIEYTALSTGTFQDGIIAQMDKGFEFDDGNMELWVNPAHLEEIAALFRALNGYAMPPSRTEGGAPITELMTHYGIIKLQYDPVIPKDNLLLLNMSDLAIAELDVPGKGNFFYEELDKKGAGMTGQLYGQAGIDYGATQRHILFKKSAD